MPVVLHSGAQTYDTVASTRIDMNAQVEDEMPVNTRFHGANNACECVRDAYWIHTEGSFTACLIELM